MKTPSLYKKLSDSWLPEIGILWLFFLSRLWNNLNLPAFVDEETLILRARDIARGKFVFAPLLNNGKWLQPAGLSLFAPDGPESLWLARITTVLLAMLSGAACIALGRMLASRGVGRLAGLFYILPALGFTVERLAVADAWMAAFSALSMVLAARLVLVRKTQTVLPLGLSMAAAMLSKVSAAPVLGVPLAAALILPRSKPARRRAVIQAVAATALAAGIVLALVMTTQRLGLAGVARGRGEFPIRSVCRHSSLCKTLSEEEGFGLLASRTLSNFGNAGRFGQWLWTLAGPPMLVLSVAALARLGSGRGRGIAYLWVVLLARAVLIVAVGHRLPYRNFLFLVVPLAVLAALAVEGLWRLPLRTSNGAQPGLQTGYAALVGMVALATALWSAPLDLAYANHPGKMRVQPLASNNCLRKHETGFAYGYDEAARTLLDWTESHSGRANVIAENDKHVVPYWGPRVGDIELWDRTDSLRVKTALWLIEGDSVFFVDKLPGRPIPDEPFGARLETVATHPLPCGDLTVRVRRLVEEGPELRRSIYEVVFPNPNESEEHYRAIAQYFIDSQIGGAVLVYPPNQFDLLNSRLQWGTALDGVFVIGDTWPLDTQEVETSLQEMAAEHDQLHVVLLAEELGDPTHAIESWLDANMELASEMAFGPVRLLSYN